MDMQCIRSNNLLRITERLNSLTFGTGTLVLPSSMVASHRVHAAERDRGTGRLFFNGRHRCERWWEMRLARQGGTRWTRKSCRGWGTCVPHQLLMFYKCCGFTIKLFPDWGKWESGAAAACSMFGVLLRNRPKLRLPHGHFVLFLLVNQFMNMGVRNSSGKVDELVLKQWDDAALCVRQPYLWCECGTPLWRYSCRRGVWPSHALLTSLVDSYPGRPWSEGTPSPETHTHTHTHTGIRDGVHNRDAAASAVDNWAHLHKRTNMTDVSHVSYFTGCRTLHWILSY